MKRVLLFVLAAILICALTGCYAAPNVPGVTPYATTSPYSGTSPGTYGNYAGRGMPGNYGNYVGGKYTNNPGVFGRFTGGAPGNYGNNVGGTVGRATGRATIGPNRTGGNIGTNGAYVMGGNAYGLR